MSLVSNEGDSEQNEIRNLQEKLESTMSLVKQLSGQLAELKEQVSELGGREAGPETPGKKPPVWRYLSKQGLLQAPCKYFSLCGNQGRALCSQ